MKRWLIYIMWNGSILAGLAYITTGQAPIGIERLIKFPFFLNFVIGLIAVFSDEIKNKIRTKGRIAPATFSHIISAVHVLWLVYLGFWVTMVFAMFGWFFALAIFDGKAEEESLEPNST